MLIPIWHPRIDEKGKLVADLVIHGLRGRWFYTPLSFRQQWWRETDYKRKPPSEEYLRQMPELLAAVKREVENDKREIAADTAKAIELLRQARQPPCEECLRSLSCKARCLRSMLG
jgi:hypothetical protein